MAQFLISLGYQRSYFATELLHVKFFFSGRKPHNDDNIQLSTHCDNGIDSIYNIYSTRILNPPRIVVFARIWRYQ